MSARTLGERLRQAIEKAGLTAVRVATKAGTTEATISNWINDQVRPENVKASMLFAIADAAQVNARYLLTGVESHSAWSVKEEPGAYETDAGDRPLPPSQSVQLEEWKIAFQLVAEALGDALTLPPEKQAEVTLLTHDLLVEGMPRAKVLRFVRAAAA